MRPRRGPWALLGTVVVLAGGIAAAAAADTMNADVARCAAISSADERLACFDTLACAAIAGARERLACYDALARARLQPGSGDTPAVKSEPAAAAAAPAVAAPAAVAGASPPSAATTAPAIPAVATTAAATAAGGSDTQSFGLVKRAPPVREQGAQQIEARVHKVEVDRYGDMRVSLDNGQVWDFAERDDAIVRPGEAVTIRRAAFGSFLLTTGSHHTYRVQRRQ